MHTVDIDDQFNYMITFSAKALNYLLECIWMENTSADSTAARWPHAGDIDPHRPGAK